MNRIQRLKWWVVLLGAAALLTGFSRWTLAAGYFTQAGRLYDGYGQEIQLRGISHDGFNSGILQPQYLWTMGWKEQIAQMKSLGFNAIRVPFVPDTLHVSTPVNVLSYVEPAKNADLIGKTPLEVLDLWMAEADRQGLYLLLDFHSVSRQRQYPTWCVSRPADYGLVWNNAPYTVEQWHQDLVFVAKRYARLSHFMGVDLYNEPNGVVRWSTGDRQMTDAANYWKPAAEGAAAAVLAANPNLLIFVQGINGNWDGREVSNMPMNWGEDFQPQAYQPLNIPLSKLVLSPHTYGPDVWVKSSFAAGNFPNNLAAHWEQLFGQFASIHPVVIGEWGGKYGTGTGGLQDKVWQEALVDYMIRKGMRSSFYWCYTPNSGDTGGILDDSLAVRQDKLSLLRRLWGSAQPIPPPVGPVTGGVVPPGVPVPGGAPQPSVLVFAPTAGLPGSLVTLVGRGLTGLNRVTLGAGNIDQFKVISDTRLQFTVPANASTGYISLFNAARSVTSSTVFTVKPVVGAPIGVPATVGYVQPVIARFFPASGPVGTSVTVTGKGFTGITHAWVGSAHHAIVRVISDTQLLVVIPAGATSGAIGIFNPSRVAFSATAVRLAPPP